MRKIFLLILSFIVIITLMGCEKSDSESSLLLFSHNRIALQKDWYWGYYNKDGKMVIDCQYEKADSFYNGVAIVVKDNQYYIIDTNGKEVIKEGYDYLYFDKETGLIWYYEHNKMGLMNVKGKKITEPIFDKGFAQFSEGLAAVAVDCKYGYINKKGDFVINPEYISADDFSYGYASVKKDNKYGFINKNNELIINYDYDYPGRFTKEGLVITGNNYKKTVLNNLGEVLVTNLNDCSVSSEFILGKTDSNYYLYDLDGNQIEDFLIPNTFHNEIELLGSLIVVIDYSDSIAVGKIINSKMETLYEVTANSLIDYFVHDNLIHFIYQKDNNIKIVNEFQEYTANVDANYLNYYNGLIVIRKDFEHGVIDHKGNIILERIYDLIYIYDDGIVVKLNNRFGIFGYNGDQILPIEFEGYRGLYINS